jgi:MYXO-CTERM domain-containing protein
VSAAFALVPMSARADDRANFVRPGAFTLRDASAEAGLGGIAMHDGAYFGTAVAFVDLDGDLWPDLYLGAGRGERDRLCLNTRDGRFACQEVGPVRTAVALAVAAADYDNDGDLDLYVMGGSNQLLENDGRAHFTDVTAAHKAAGDGSYTPTGTFFDYDGDGLLDLYLGRGDSGLDGDQQAPQVLRQNPDRTFTDVTAASGLSLAKNTLAMIAFDYDGDMRQDVLVTGNFDLVSLFHNEGGGHFVNVTAHQSAGFQQAVTEGMGLDVADFDGDGDFDIYASNSLNNTANPGSGFFVNRGDGTFDSMAKPYGVLADFGWGNGWADFDNDSWPDILVVGNRVDHHYLFRNIDGQRFEQQLLPHAVSGMALDCITAAFADYDRDGMVDVLLASLDGTPIQLLHNETPSLGNWIAVSLEGARQRDPLGALVEVHAGGRVLKRQLLSQTSKGSQNERPLRFGVGTANTVDVTITWPGGGSSEHLAGVPVNELVSIQQGCSASGAAWPAACDQVMTHIGPGDPLPMPKHTGCAVAPGGAAAESHWPVWLIGLIFLGVLRRTV